MFVLTYLKNLKDVFQKYVFLKDVFQRMVCELLCVSEMFMCDEIIKNNLEFFIEKILFMSYHAYHRKHLKRQ